MEHVEINAHVVSNEDQVFSVVKSTNGTPGILSFIGDTSKPAMLAFHPDGNVFVNGTLASNNLQVVEEFRHWLQTTRCYTCSKLYNRRLAELITNE